MTKNKRIRLHNQTVKKILNQIDTTLNRTDRNRVLRDLYKTTIGCEDCGYNAYACVLQLDHIDPATKFRNSKGALVDPGNMVYQSTEKMLEEYLKCRVMCANCHAVHTFTVQRKPRMSVADVRLAA